MMLEPSLEPIPRRYSTFTDFRGRSALARLGRYEPARLEDGGLWSSVGAGSGLSQSKARTRYRRTLCLTIGSTCSILLRLARASKPNAS